MTGPQSVLITGASRGIGKATALLLDQLGYRVFAGVRCEPDGAALRTVSSDRLLPVILDVTDANSIAGAVESIATHTDSLDGLVNNAGLPVGGPIEALPMDEIRLQFEVNVFGVISVTRAFLAMIRNARGRIINISSINGRIVTPFNTPYGASKFALEALSDGLRLELKPWGIEVVVIQPGPVATPIWETALARAVRNSNRYSTELKERYEGVVNAMARRNGEPPPQAVPPERVARVIAQALIARHPRTRYLVGGRARLGATLKALLPDRWLDALLTGRWKKRRRGGEQAER